MNFKQYLIPLFTILFSGCVSIPTPVYRLTPVGHQSTFLQGYEIVRLEQRGIGLVVNFNKVDDGKLVFDIDIANLSDSSTFVASVDSMYLVVEKLRPSRENVSDEVLRLEPPKKLPPKSARYYAFNPEKMLLEIDKNLERDREAQQVSERIARRRAERIEQQEVESASASQLLWHSEQRRVLESTALRKTTLTSNTAVTGKVFFPLVPQARIIKLHLKIHNKEFEISFKQEEL